MISQEKWQRLRQLMSDLGITEQDLDEQFIIGSGRGGQNLQKTHSCVMLKHQPSGITIKCQQDRSRAANRFFARRRLCEKIQAGRDGVETKQREAISKIHRQKLRCSRRAKAKIQSDKKHNSMLKQSRQAPDPEE